MATSEASPEDLAAASEKILAFFCDHFVSLSGSYVELDPTGGDVGEEKFFAYSGFVQLVRGVWCLVTAGHSIEYIENPLRAQKIRLTNCCLADYFGSKPRVKEPTPFDYDGARFFAVHDSTAGLDFALIPLRPLYQMGLEANGIRPISEEHWISQDASACDFFALLGLPECLVPNPTNLVAHGDRKAGIVKPTMVWVYPVTLSADEIPPATFPWFIGRVGSAAKLPSIVGMSGGPIFGFRKTPTGELLYWILAVQSWWRPVSRTIFGCPIRVFRDLVERELRLIENAVAVASEEHGDA